MDTIPNVTVAVGREARIPCKVRNLGSYRVSGKLLLGNNILTRRFCFWKKVWGTWKRVTRCKGRGFAGYKRWAETELDWREEGGQQNLSHDNTWGGNNIFFGWEIYFFLSCNICFASVFSFFFRTSNKTVHTTPSILPDDHARSSWCKSKVSSFPHFRLVSSLSCFLLTGRQAFFASWNLVDRRVDNTPSGKLIRVEEERRVLWVTWVAGDRVVDWTCEAIRCAAFCSPSQSAGCVAACRE